MSIPVFISEVRATATDTVAAGAGSTQNIPTTRYYFLISNKQTAGNGQSLLTQLQASLNASSGTVWTVSLTSDLKIKLAHNGGGTVNAIINRVLAWNLGFAMVFASSYPPSAASTITIPVPTGAGGYTAEFRSPWLWCPEMRVSMTGPDLFDPMVEPGIQSSTGAVARSPDGTVSAVSQGIQTDAVFAFKGVHPLYRARPSDPNKTSLNPHEREDCLTWWRSGPCLGRRVLFWRDKASLATGFGYSTGTTTLAPAYVEYYPDAATRQKPAIVASAPPHLYYWDITLGFTLTERGVTAYVD